MYPFQIAGYGCWFAVTTNQALTSLTGDHGISVANQANREVNQRDWLVKFLE